MQERSITILLWGVIGIAVVALVIATIAIWREARAENAAHKAGAIKYTIPSR